MKVINIVGARPQFVKAAMVSRALRSRPGTREILLHTGQHFDRAMSGDLLDELGFPPMDYNLGINQLSHGAMTGRMLEEIEKVLIAEKPDYVIVYGDTNSTVAGALAARKMHIRVAHIEAGMRSFNMKMPEEINRVMTDRISDLLFCSSDTSAGHLRDEGFGHFPCQVITSGDVMYDAYLHFLPLAAKATTVLDRLPFREFALCTLHRESNVDHRDQLAAVLSALDRIHSELPVVLPLHPRTAKRMEEWGIRTKVHCIPPVTYLDMLALLQRCTLVLTDSGGLQKEAYFAEKPCLTLRYETEWTELVEKGYNKLVGTDPDWILNNFRWMMEQPVSFEPGIYGNGHAAEVIAGSILRPAATPATA
ncbi:MAG: hypothetical protein RL213_2229 [Bacteroidota bacterium]|jgi:UDP-GlcNAc3NAcA epimerase